MVRKNSQTVMKSNQVAIDKKLMIVRADKNQKIVFNQLAKDTPTK